MNSEDSLVSELLDYLWVMPAAQLVRIVVFIVVFWFVGLFAFLKFLPPKK